MACKTCEEIKEIDGIMPDCETEKGCIIPSLSHDEARILEIRRKLITLRDIIDAGTILKMYEATKEDIKMLAFVEEEIKKLQPEEEKNG